MLSVKIKRNWMYETKLVYIYFVTIALILGILACIFNNFTSIYRDILVGIYSKVYEIMILVVGAYPIVTFIRVVPKGEENRSRLVLHLPYSIKRVLWDDIKNWIYIYPIIFIISTIILRYVNPKYIYGPLEMLLISGLLLSFQMQIASVVIISLAKEIKLYITGISAVVLNIIVFPTTIYFVSKANIDVNKDIRAMIILTLIVGVISIAVFIYSFKDIENISR